MFSEDYIQKPIAETKALSEILRDYFATKGVVGALEFMEKTLTFDFMEIKGNLSLLFTLSLVLTMFELLDLVFELLSAAIMS